MEVLTTVNKINFNFNDYKEKFFTFKDIKDTSRKTYRQSLDQFGKWLNDNGIIRPVYQDIKTYKDYLQEKGLSIFTSNSYLIAVKTFFKFLDRVKLYPDITTEIKLYKKPKEHTKNSLTEKQIKQLYDNFNQDNTLKGLRDRAIFILALTTGLREKEITGLNVEDIQQKNDRTGLYILGKGRDHKEFIILPGIAIKHLQEYLTARRHIKKDDPLFISISNNSTGKRMSRFSISRLGKEYFRAIGINTPLISFHSLRHSAISFLVRQLRKENEAVNLMTVQRFSRHNDINTTMRYIHEEETFTDPATDHLASYLQEFIV